MKNYLSKDFFDSHQQILRKMKMTCLMAMVFASSVFATNAESQVAKVSITVKDASITKVIDAIESQTDYLFVYNKNEIDLYRKVDVDVKNQAVVQVLSGIFTNTNVVYAMEGTNIMLLQKNQIQQPGQTQQPPKTVSGTVTDTSGATLPGVSVYIKGTTNGTSTDANGRFSINDVPDNATLVFSFVGMKTQEIVVGNNAVIKVVMTSEAVTMEEVVVIGYGTSKKSDIVGSISSVKASELSTITAPSIANMLQGKAAGLVVNTTSAQPGGGFSFNIRGLASTGIGNEPLVIVDGYPISNDNTDPVANARYNTGFKNTSLTSINAEDIESIEVLKDASATAIYGARAGHGVILITTKRGKAGKTQVEYSMNYTIQKLMVKPKMLDGPDYMRQTNRFLYEQYLSQNEIFPYGTNMLSETSSPFSPRYSEDQINSAITTNWFDLITRNGAIQQHNLSIRGGGANTKYLLSFNAYNHDGVIESNSFDRYTGRFNLDQNFGKYITGGVSFLMSSIKNNNFANNSTGELADRGTITNALWFSPALPVKDANGKYTLNPNYPLMPNPVSLLEITDITKTNRYLANSYLQIEPVKGLIVKATLGFDSQTGLGYSYIPVTVLYGMQQNGRADRTYQNRFSWQYDFTINYNKTVAEAHNINLLLGYSQQEFRNDNFSAGNANFLTDSYLYNNLGNGTLTKPFVSSNASSSAIAGYFSRLMYNFKNRYYLTATVRRDGSSDFASNQKWGLFPSFAVAWRADQETFLKPIELISQLKIRASWGQTGNSGLGGRANAYYGNAGSYVFGANGGNIFTGIRLIQLDNPDLKWETTTEVNFGLDLGILKNRVTLNVELFHRVISDLLSSRTLPGYLELSSVAANIGKTQSDGMEFTLNTVNISKPDYSWNSTFTLSYYYDRWKERDPSWVPGAWENVDDPIRMNTGYLDDGLINIGDKCPWINNPLPGTTKYRDIDGFLRDASGNIQFDELGRGIKTGKPDGQMDDADVRVRFVDKPVYIGFSNSFKYKIFDLNIYLYGVLNRIGWDPNQMTSGSSLTTESINAQEAVKNAWTHDNPNGSPWAQQNDFSRKLGATGIQNMAFIRVKDLNFGISIPKNTLPKFVENFRAFVAVSNLGVFTKYTGWDPETDYGTGAYPNPRSFSFGINVGF